MLVARAARGCTHQDHDDRCTDPATIDGTRKQRQHHHQRRRLSFGRCCVDDDDAANDGAPQAPTTAAALSSTPSAAAGRVCTTTTAAIGGINTLLTRRLPTTTPCPTVDQRSMPCIACRRGRSSIVVVDNDHLAVFPTLQPVFVLMEQALQLLAASVACMGLRDEQRAQA